MSDQNYMDTDNKFVPNFIERPAEQLYKMMTDWGKTSPNITSGAIASAAPHAQITTNGLSADEMSVRSVMESQYGKTGGFQPTFWDKMFGYQKGDVQYGAMAPALLQGVGGIAESILGWGQLSEAKRQNAFTQDNWQKQYNNQATLTNASLRDRQSARVAAAPGAYQSVGEYMQQNKVG